MSSKVLTITLNPTVDKSTSIEKLLPEKKLRCNQPLFEPGGGGINVSRGLTRLGIENSAFFTSGGRTGKLLESLLEKEGVVLEAFQTHAETRENFIVVEEASNQQYRFGMPGEPLLVDEQEVILKHLASINPFPEFVVISGSLPPGIEGSYIADIIRVIKQRGAKVIVDTSGDALVQAVEEGVYLLKPNLGELSKLSGVDVLDNDSTDDAAKILIDSGKATVVVVSMGPQGAYLVTKDEAVHIPAPAVKKLSTVGAGDSMVAGMVSMLVQNKSFYEMAAMGVACGSGATINPGTGLFKKSDALKLYEWIMKRKK